MGEYHDHVGETFEPRSSLVLVFLVAWEQFPWSVRLVPAGSSGLYGLTVYPRCSVASDSCLVSAVMHQDEQAITDCWYFPVGLMFGEAAPAPVSVTNPYGRRHDQSLPPPLRSNAA